MVGNQIRLSIGLLENRKILKKLNYLSIVIEQFFKMDDFIFEHSGYSEDQEECISYFHDPDQISEDQPLFPFAKTQEHKNTAESDSHVTEQPSEKIPKTYTEGLFQYKTRQKLKIEVNCQTTKKKYIDSKKGKKGDTSDLTANSKTLLQKVFEQQRLLNQLTCEEARKIAKYKDSHSNIPSIRTLFGIEQEFLNLQICKVKQSKEADGLRRIFIEKTSGSWIIEQTLSSKLSFQSKIIALKHLEVFRKAGIAPSEFQNWKNQNP